MGELVTSTVSEEVQNDAVAAQQTESESSSTTKQEVPSGAVLFGKYELQRLLGVGAFAKVYEATNVETGQRVAVKAVSKHKVLHGGLMWHIEREISIMRRLHHRHIVDLFEVLATKTKIYFIMEFAGGGDIFQKIATDGRFSEDLSRRYFQQLISAIGYCHSSGVFHRDLKLDNVLIDDNKDLKVSDFGLSAVKEQIRPDGSLHTICGTPAYVAPEILAKKGYDGAKVDIWSCGIILFALTAGYLPFNDYNITVLYRKIYRGQFRFAKWMSLDLRNLLSRLLDTNPKTRITVDEILRDPWFNKGGYRVMMKEPRWDDLDIRTRVNGLNAFDLISFGLDMSGLLSDPELSDCAERIVSRETPEKIMEKVAEVVAEEGRVTAKREEKGLGAKLEGQDGNLVILLRIYWLTGELVVVEIRGWERKVECGGKFWKDKLRPHLLELVHVQDAPVIR